MKNLYILWTNSDEITSEKMVMMYALNSLKYGWWEKVTVIIWGAPNKLIAENDLIKQKIQDAQEQGVFFSACKSCADELGTTKTLMDLNIEVKYWGVGLTEILKGNDKLITI